MIRKSLRLLSAGMFLALAGAAVGGATALPDKPLREIAGYRRWTRLNEKPTAVDSSPAFFA
jgi:hypothetical protein